MKSKQLFDDDFVIETPKNTVLDSKDKHKTNKGVSNIKTKENKKKTIKSDVKNIDNSSCSTNRNSSISTNSNKKNKKGSEGICRSDESAKSKSKGSTKNDSAKQATKSKNDKDVNRRTKDEKSRNRKSDKNSSTENVVNREKTTKKRSELIEDCKKGNAPDEYLIGKFNPRTGEIYKQLSCCKQGWTYIDVTDSNWLKTHCGFDGTIEFEHKYSRIDKK